MDAPLSRSPEEPATLLDPELFGKAVQYGPQLGSYVGRFKLLEVAARGGAGTVFKAIDSAGDPVAVKVLLMPPEGRTEVMERFEREVRSLQSLTSPNVVELLDFGKIPQLDLPYIVLEWLDGERLGKYIKTHGPLSLTETWDIAKQLLLALTQVHDAGFVHRDVSANNVMLSEREGRRHVTLIDFGLVKPRPGHYSAVTRPGVIVGTPSVMAPEQFEPPKVDERVDIYAVGALLSYMLTGRNPLSGASLAEAGRARLHAKPRRPSEDIALHPAVDGVVTKCLERLPEKRYRSAAELSVELEHAIKAASSSALKTLSRNVISLCLRSRSESPAAVVALDEFEREMGAQSVGQVTRAHGAVLALVDAPPDAELAQAVLAQATSLMERLCDLEPQLVLTLHADTVMVRLDDMKLMGGPLLEMLRWPLPDEGNVFVSRDMAEMLPMLVGRPDYGELKRVV
jgi:serine/threonine protein kinase